MVRQHGYAMADAVQHKSVRAGGAPLTAAVGCSCQSDMPAGT